MFEGCNGEAWVQHVKFILEGKKGGSKNTPQQNKIQNCPLT